MGARVVKLDNLSEEIVNEMVTLWEASVKFSHHFLSEKDIEDIKKSVSGAIMQVENILLMVDEQENIEAFCGMAEKKIEMLFVSPSKMGQGHSKKLIEKSLLEFGVQFVDVNEQNQEAVEFYEHMGFYVFSRSALDNMGRAFPILHMKYDKN